MMAMLIQKYLFFLSYVLILIEKRSTLSLIRPTTASLQSNGKNNIIINNQIKRSFIEQIFAIFSAMNVITNAKDNCFTFDNMTMSKSVSKDRLKYEINLIFSSQVSEGNNHLSDDDAAASLQQDDKFGSITVSSRTTRKLNETHQSIIELLHPSNSQTHSLSHVQSSSRRPNKDFIAELSRLNKTSKEISLDLIEKQIVNARNFSASKNVSKMIDVERILKNTDNLVTARSPAKECKFFDKLSL